MNGHGCLIVGVMPPGFNFPLRRAAAHTPSPGRDHALIASARYRPGFYPGELTLFSPAEREPSLPSLQSIWRKHARAASIVETAGTHWTMLSVPNAESTAAFLTQRLPMA